MPSSTTRSPIGQENWCGREQHLADVGAGSAGDTFRQERKLLSGRVTMTYSIIGRDPDTGELGIAVQSRYFAVGCAVPWIEAGVGVIASQAFTNPVYGQEGLRLLRSGLQPQEVLGRLLREDEGQAVRQVAIVDAHGRTALHTGTQCVAAAGHSTGSNCCAQANMMAKDTVWEAMVQAFERGVGRLADRLVAAMEAAEREGGDLRGKQSASLFVVSGPSASAVPQDRFLDLRVDDHWDLVAEIKRLLSYARSRQRADQAVQKAMAQDVSGALADLDVCCGEYPKEPEFLFRRSVVLLLLGRIPEAREMLQAAQAIHPGWSELLLRFADAGVIPTRREMLEPLVSGLAPPN
jgi:uncharacterized Ntn-hydrolase superfamily protein